MINSIPPRAGIYFRHYECFGHTSRVMALGEVFRKRFPKGDLFFIQAADHQPRATIERQGRVFALSKNARDRGHFKGAFSVSGSDADKRSQACIEILKREKSDLFITESFPLGNEGSRYALIEPLAYAKKQGTVLWGAAGYPLLTGIDQAWRQKIVDFYQKIFIFSPPLEKDRIADSYSQSRQKQAYLDFFEKNRQKIIFAGYLLAQHQVVIDDEDENIFKPPVPKGSCRVTVIRGGGSVYPKVIAQAIRASDLLGKDYYLTVVAGPSTTSQEWYYFSTLVAKKRIQNLLLLRSVGDYEGLIAGSDVCVSLAGYHSSVMMLKHQKKAVIIPFEGYGSKTIQEQLARASVLKERIGARVLPISDLTAEHLKTAIEGLASQKKMKLLIPKDWFGGASVFDKALTGLFGR